MARRHPRRFLDDEQDEARWRAKLHALEELNALRHSIETRNGVCPDDLIAEVRAERERQRDTVLTPTERNESRS